MSNKSAETVVLEDGKYTFRVDSGGALWCARYSDQDWRHFVGDKAVHALFDEVLRLRKALRLEKALRMADLSAMRDSW